MTLGEKAYVGLRKAILRGEFAPGQPLRLAHLRDRFGFGFSPLREALTRLTAERLVTSEALRGFRVAPLSLEELTDTMETRIFVETEALRRAIARGGDVWESAIVSTLHGFKRQVERTAEAGAEGQDALEDRHRDFHRALISGCGSARLMEIFDNLYMDSARYRGPWFHDRADIPGRDLVAEHSRIADATLARDTELATDLLTEHYRQTTALRGALGKIGIEAA